MISIPITRSGHGVNDVRQTEIHIAEPLVPDPSAFEVDILKVQRIRYTRFSNYLFL